MARKRTSHASQLSIRALETRSIPPLTLRATFTPESIDAEKRTAEVVWTTGAKVKRGGFFTEPFWEELSLQPEHVRLARLNGGAPLLDTHSSFELGSVLGVVQPGTARVDGKVGTATVRFARAEDDPNADAVFRKVKDGIIRNISVGYRVHKFEKIEDDTQKVPTMRAVDWEPYELSVVPIGADAQAGFRSDVEENPCVFATRQERTMEEKTPTPTPTPDPAEEVARSARAARVENAKEKAEHAAKAVELALEDERKRVARLTELAQRHEMGSFWLSAAIEKRITVEQAHRQVLDFIAQRDEGIVTDQRIRIGAGDDARDKFIAAGTMSIIERAGHVDTIERAKQVPRLAKYFRGMAPDSGQFGGMTLMDLARASLEQRGVSVRGLHGETLIRRALEFRGDAGMNTTSDFAVLLENALNKIFLGAYAIADVTWPRWCGRKSVQDFRTSNFYRPGTFGVLDTVTEAGEIKHKNIPDGVKRTLTPSTKGNIVGITRRAMVNDDLGAFRELATELGKAAALSIETDAFTMITSNSGLGIAYGDGQNFFYARAAGTNIGPTGAMSATTIDGARAVMARQKDASANQFLSLRPAIWLGPVELGGVAKQFNSSTTDPTDNKAPGIINKVLNLFRDVVDSPFLSASSTTRHYLLTDPASNPAFVVGFIDGNEAPRIESEQLFGYDGMQMKVILDYGTAAIDYRCAVTCAGA